jgi:hypothetical protein
VTILGSNSATTLQTTHTLSYHYQFRVMVSLWWLSSSSGDIRLILSTAPAQTIIPISAPIVSVNATASNSYQAYCGSSLATNYDLNVTNYYDDTITVKFDSTSADWGIR